MEIEKIIVIIARAHDIIRVKLNKVSLVWIIPTKQIRNYKDAVTHILIDIFTLFFCGFE